MLLPKKHAGPQLWTRTCLDAGRTFPALGMAAGGEKRAVMGFGNSLKEIYR